MDGVLIEWEKMLPNPDEINELDQPDTCLMDSDLNESPTGEVTQMTSLINFMPEENKKTIKLIEELNTLQNCEKNVDATGVSFSCNNFNEKKKGTSPVTESDQNIVKSSVKDNNSNVNKNEDDNSSSNKYLNGFSNCLDSPLQISDVRTGDIPSEIKTDDTLSKGRTNDILSEIGIDIMKRGVITEYHKENIVDTKELKSNTDGVKHIVKISGKTQSNSLAPTIEITSPIKETTHTGFSVESNDKVPDNNLYTENSYIMLAIKQEPVDYEDYGKSSRQESEENVRHEEFMNNFYNEMNDDNEIEYKGSADHTMTASGLYQCVYCSCKITDYAQFQIHLKQRHTTLYECKYCDKKFVRSQQLAIHCRVSHTAEKEAMETLTFENLKMVIKRKKAKVFYDDDGNQIYKCAYCGKSFYVQQAMASHVRNVHHNNFKTHDKLKRGNDDHKKCIPVFKCKFCEETFKKKLELTLHMKNMHSYRVRFREKATVYHDEDGNLIYKCAYCEKEFHIQQALASHVRNKHPLSSKILKEESVQSEPSTVQTKISDDLVKDEKELKFERHESLPENESKSMNQEITSPKVLPYRNMSFECDVNQMEETLASSDCSLKRELKSNQIYHCSKCTKWFYREKQVLNHEKICTFIKEEPDNEEQQGVEVHDGIDDKHGSRQEHLKQQREIRENIEAKLHTQVQIDIVKRLKEKMIIRKKQKSLMSKIEYSSRAREENDFLPKFFCKYCPSSFDDGKSMNLHLVKHLGDVRRTDGLYTCRICKQSFLSCRKMLCHLQNHTAFVMTLLHRQASIPECDICGQPFVNLLLLRKHQNKHVKVDNPVLSTSTSVFKTESIGISLIDSSAEKLNTVNNADSILGHNKIDIIPSSGGNTLDDVRKHHNKHVKVDNPVYVQQDAEVHDGIRMDDHVNDVPFQCGMCLSRFPNSQYLLHHITLHMHGPYVFKIEMKDKKGTHGNEQTSNSTGNLSCYGKAFSLSLKEHDSKQVANKSDKPVILTMPKFKQLKNASDSVSTPTSMNIVASATNVSSITQDHMYTNSLLTSIPKFQVSNMDGSDTDSAEEVNLGSVYKTGESQRQLTMEKKCLPRKRKSTSNNEINYRMSNFKKCLNIAGGQWFECPLCLNLCETQRLLEVHMRSHEQNDVSMVKCGVCERQFLSKYVLSRHMEQSHKKNSYKCSICGQGFLTSEKVISHVQEVHHG